MPTHSLVYRLADWGQGHQKGLGADVCERCSRGLPALEHASAGASTRTAHGWPRGAKCQARHLGGRWLDARSRLRIWRPRRQVSTCSRRALSMQGRKAPRQGWAGMHAVSVCVCVCLCLQVHRMCVSVVFGILLCEASHARCTRCGRAGVLSLAKEAALDASIVTPFTSLVFVVNSAGSGLRCNSSATGAASAPPRPYTHACVHTLCSSLRNTSATGVALRWLLASSRVRAYPC